MSEYGLLEEVRRVPRGSTLAAAAAISDTELVVDTAGDFNYDPDDPDNSGGTLDLNGARLTYSSVIFGELPDDPDTIVLDAPLAAAADEDDAVSVVLGGQIAEDWVALVTMGAGDAVHVPLSVDQRSQWPIGVYEDPVPVVVSDDLLHLEDAPGRTTSLRATIWAEDHTTAPSDDADAPLTLSFTPTPHTLAVYKNGLRLRSSEFTLAGRIVTVLSGTEVVIRADDEISAYYEYDSAAFEVAVVTPTWRDTAPQHLNGFLIPDGAEIGDLLLFVAMMPNTESVTNLNGADPVGFSDYVTHSAIGPGTRTYRIEAYSMINDGSSVPTVSNVAAQDVVCATTAFANGSSVGGIFDTVANDTAADAPALAAVSLRVAGTIGNSITITPSRGDVVLSTNYSEIDIAVTIDDDPSPAPFSASGTAGWCTGSLVVTA